MTKRSSKVKVVSIVLVAVLMFGALFTGCSKEETNNDVSQGDKSNSVSQEDKNSQEDNDSKEEKVTLTWSTTGNPGENKRFEEFNENFMKKYPNVEINFIPIPSGSYNEKIVAQLASHTAPDVFYASNGLSNVFTNDKLENLKPYMDKSSVLSYDDFTNENMFTLSEVDGGIYGVCPDDNPMVIYFNGTMFKEKGLKTPLELYEAGEWNWDTFADSARQLSDQSGRIKQYGYVQDVWWSNMLPWIYAGGADIFSEDSTKSALDEQAAIDAVSFVKGLIDDKAVAYVGSLGEGSSQNADTMFMSGQTAMVFSGRWVTPLYKDITDFEWDIAPFPTKSGELFALTPGYTYVVMNKESEVKDEAWTFIEEFVGKEGQIFRLKDGGNATGSVKGVNEEILTGGYPKSEALWFDLVEISTWTPLNFGKYSQTSKFFTDGMSKIFMGETDVETGLKETSDKINEFLAEQN